MPIGIRPTNDFAFKKIFGSEENKVVSMSLLNAIIELASPIVSITILNPYTVQDFKDDKLGILDIKATDQSGSVYDIEIQLSFFKGLVQRVVFYGCEIYTEQLTAGKNYDELNPAFSICLLDGTLWSDSDRVHHRFRLYDQDSGRTLDNTLEIHILELGRYDLTEQELKTASTLDQWLFWLLNADRYEPEELMRLFPAGAMLLASKTLIAINEITEDKTMYDAREKAIRDLEWKLSATLKEGVSKGKVEGKIEGRIEGKIESRAEEIQSLQEMNQIEVSELSVLCAMKMRELDDMKKQLQDKLRERIR